MDPTVLFWLAAVPAAFIVGLSKGGLSSIGMLGVPIMSLAISPVAAAGLLLPLLIVSDMFGLWAFRRDYSAINVRIIVGGALIGIGLGWALAQHVSPDLIKLVVGIIGLVFCIYRLLTRAADAPPRPADLPRGIFWGAVAGFTSFVSHSGAPPFQVYVLPQRLPKLTYAGTTTITFAIINLLKLPPYLALGQISIDSFREIAILALVAIGGTFTALKITRLIPETVFFRIVNTLLLIVSIKLVWDGGSYLVRQGFG